MAGLHLLRPFARWSGLHEYVQHYGVASQPEGVVFANQTLQIGVVRWRRCVRIAYARDGLYLSIASGMTGVTNLLVPWHALQMVGEKRLFSRRGVELAVAGCAKRMVVYRDMYMMIRPFLESAGTLSSSERST